MLYFAFHASPASTGCQPRGWGSVTHSESVKNPHHSFFTKLTRFAFLDLREVDVSFRAGCTGLRGTSSHLR
jgi:hypothetical protein